MPAHATVSNAGVFVTSAVIPAELETTLKNERKCGLNTDIPFLPRIFYITSISIKISLQFLAPHTTMLLAIHIFYQEHGHDVARK